MKDDHSYLDICNDFCIILPTVVITDQLKLSLLLDSYLVLWIVTVNGVNEYRYYKCNNNISSKENVTLSWLIMIWSFGIDKS